MVNVDFKEIASRYEKELRENCLPFWLEHSQDKEYGGYFSCLNRDGSVYDESRSASGRQGIDRKMCGNRSANLSWNNIGNP